MIKAFLARMKQGHRTIRYPAAAPPELAERFRGRPRFDASLCPGDCRSCVEACPSSALRRGEGIEVDLGRCLFCRDCVEACPSGAVSYSRDYRMAVRERADLVLPNGGAGSGARVGASGAAGGEGADELRLAAALGDRLRRMLGRSLKLRQVSAGGCNACEADVNVLGTIGWDLGRFGIQLVASPRHADGLLVTGPVTKNMALALRKTWDAVPAPKIVIAVGACAISGGPYVDHDEVENGVASLLPVDLFVPGCPPHPLTILDGLLRLVGRIRS